MRKQQKKKDFCSSQGQSLLEYIVLVAAVLGLLVVFLRPGGRFSQEVTNIVEQQGDDMFNMATQIFR